MLLEIFEKLNKSIDYVYFRDKDVLVHLKPGDDIDILIKRKELPKLKEILFKYGYICLDSSKARKVGFFNYKHNLPHFDVQIDKIVKLPYLSGFFANKLQKDGLNLLNPEFKLKILILKDLMIHGVGEPKPYSESKIEEIKKLWPQHGITFRNECKNLFGSEEMADLVGEENFTEITAKRSKWRRQALFRNFKFIKYIFENLWYQTKRRKGKVITFIGVDGSGKSTTIANLEKILPSCTSIYMGRWIRSEAVRKASNLVKGKKTKWKSFARDCLYIIKYYWLLLRLLRYKGKYNYILADRWIYDLHLQKDLHFLWKPFVKFYPKPDLTFHLYADPEKVLERKGQFDVETLQKQDDKLKQFEGIRIKTEDKEKTIDEILWQITTKL